MRLHRLRLHNPACGGPHFAEFYQFSTPFRHFFLTHHHDDGDDDGDHDDGDVCARRMSH